MTPESAGPYRAGTGPSSGDAAAIGLAEARLYAFVDTGYLAGRSPEILFRELAEGGADLIQFRAKDWPLEGVRRTAVSLLAASLETRVPLVINDYPELALETGANFFHLGQEDVFERRDWTDLFAGRRTFRFGLSTHEPEQARRALAAGPDYIAIGPVYSTGTKPGVKPATLEYVRWAAANVAIPWFAIGGIRLDNLDAVLEAGARRVAVVSAILNAPEVARTCQQFKKRLLSVPVS